MNDDFELQVLFIAAFYGVAFGLVGAGSVLLWRFFRKQPLWSSSSVQLGSPLSFYVGVVFFCGLAVWYFWGGRKLFSLTFLIFAALHVFGLLAYHRRAQR